MSSRDVPARSGGATRYCTAVIDACSESIGHAPHLRRPLFPRQDGGSHSPEWLWCLGHYDQQRQNRRVCIAVTDEREEMVGEGLTIVGAAYREQREPGECGECREPEDFGWDGAQIVNGAPIIACFRHGAAAPGWMYASDVEPGLLAYRSAEALRPVSR